MSENLTSKTSAEWANWLESELGRQDGGEAIRIQKEYVRALIASLRGSDEPPAAQSCITRVFRTCVAYESGVGHGLAKDKLPNPYMPGTDEHTAYASGYEFGERQQRDTQPPAAAQADREDMENIGRAFMESLHRNMPDYSWSECPSEVIVDLINERDDARASQPPRECLHCKWPAGTCVEVEYEDGEPGEPGVIVENPEIRVRFEEDGAMEVVFPESRLRRATATKSAVIPVGHAVSCRLFPDPHDERDPVGPCTCGATDEPAANDHAAINELGSSIESQPATPVHAGETTPPRGSLAKQIATAQQHIAETPAYVLGEFGEKSAPALCDCDEDTGCKEYAPAVFRCHKDERAATDKSAVQPCEPTKKTARLCHCGDLNCEDHAP